MIHQLLATCTMLSVLIHATLGCCIHHLHAGQGDIPAEMSHTHHHAHEHCRHHHATDTNRVAAEPNGNEGQHDVPHHSCDDHICSLVFVRTIHADNLQRIENRFQSLALPRTCSVNDLAGIGTSTTDGHSAPPGHFAPSCPLHAVVQVWRL